MYIMTCCMIFTLIVTCIGFSYGPFYKYEVALGTFMYDDLYDESIHNTNWKQLFWLSP
jgi:hypothetical protein